MANSLTQADVAKLMANPSPSIRAETTSKIATQFEQKELNESERKIAEDIFRTLVKDAEIRVREALSAQLKLSPDLPRDIAVSLANDVDSVALPMLKFSEVLTDEDLIAIVGSQCPAKQVAIAQRATVSAQVSDALIDTGNESAVARLVANEGADITETSFGKVMTNYSDSDIVADSMARRPSLPPAVSEQLVNAITERLQDYLEAKHELPKNMASNLILQARERATIGLVGRESTDGELADLVDQLHRYGRLSPSLVLRALCVGDMFFFEMAMAKLGDLPLKNVKVLIHDQGSLGLESVYLRTGLPSRLFPAVRAAIDVAKQTDFDGQANDRERHMEHMLERILTQFEDPSKRMAEEDIDYLMEKLKQCAA